MDSNAWNTTNCQGLQIEEIMQANAKFIADVIATRANAGGTAP